MKEIFDLLEKSERRIVILLCVFLAAALIFHQGFALKQKKAYRHSAESLPKQQKEFENIKELNREIKMKWLQWDEARRDIADIEKKYFYKENKNINQLRLDLEKIFRAAGVRVISDLTFDYADREEEKLKRVHVHFTMEGSYIALKGFIHQVEIHPKFLMIERIDFRNIDTQSGRIELQIALAGYYEN
jgi:Tfp pilus assembly protein PilO